MSNRFYPSSLCCMLCAALLAIPAGCQQAESEDAEHDHHLEHFVPKHKPANFAEAVEELEHRTDHLKFHIGEDSEIVRTEVQELADIVAWVPELAADSDLNEADWTVAATVSKKMASSFDASGSVANLESLLESMQPQIELLEPLVERAGKPEPDMRHDHDGHHDHGHGHDHDHDEDNEDDHADQSDAVESTSAADGAGESIEQ